MNGFVVVLPSSTDDVVGTELGIKQVRESYMRPPNGVKEEKEWRARFEGEVAPFSVWRVLTWRHKRGHAIGFNGFS